jgi:Cu(I)/Ag(I) efflux system protein CusF
MKPFIPALLLAATLPALASHAPNHALESKAALPQVEGEVRRIDAEAGKITLKHGAIPNLDMMGMTMVFRVKDPAMLKAVKPGDKVRFRADNVKGALTVTDIAAIR